MSALAYYRRLHNILPTANRWPASTILGLAIGKPVVVYRNIAAYLGYILFLVGQDGAESYEWDGNRWF